MENLNETREGGAIGIVLQQWRCNIFLSAHVRVWEPNRNKYHPAGPVPESPPTGLGVFWACCLFSTSFFPTSPNTAGPIIPHNPRYFIKPFSTQ